MTTALRPANRRGHGKRFVCPVPDCGTAIEHRKLLCHDCYERLPMDLRYDLFRTYKAVRQAGAGVSEMQAFLGARARACNEVRK